MRNFLNPWSTHAETRLPPKLLCSWNLYRCVKNTTLQHICKQEFELSCKKKENRREEDTWYGGEADESLHVNQEIEHTVGVRLLLDAWDNARGDWDLVPSWVWKTVSTHKSRDSHREISGRKHTSYTPISANSREKNADSRWEQFKSSWEMFACIRAHTPVG